MSSTEAPAAMTPTELGFEDQERCGIPALFLLTRAPSTSRGGSGPEENYRSRRLSMIEMRVTCSSPNTRRTTSLMPRRNTSAGPCEHGVSDPPPWLAQLTSLGLMTTTAPAARRSRWRAMWSHTSSPLECNATRADFFLVQESSIALGLVAIH